MTEALAIQQTELQFRWKYFLNNPETLAVIYACHYGYCSRDALISALPIFQPARLQQALQALLSAGLMEIIHGELVLSEDAVKLDQLTRADPPLVIPTASDELVDDDRIALFSRLGIDNPGVALGVIRIDARMLEAAV